MDILTGLDDVPAVGDDKCCRCERKLDSVPFSGWFVFAESHGQMYQVPICDDCNAKEKPEKVIEKDCKA